ncbi:MetQ/NlpA family ABC transporter substrate-binding protein [Falseniella ignava]|uniref:Lipoprotein n=1 Tax=Falseniella ignava CCUG 37419 TaxID=883112 RepID=K1M9C8_9LACT|nr:MetQ/NlpA family ABC transporter substrate-binding protein [Falseniella ignava]EKB58993.1 YaeC family lipoprotein [Falseniella ignava CCUG 37419]
MKKFLKALSAAVVLAGSFIGLGTEVSAEPKFEDEKVTVGVCSEAEEEVWKVVAERAKEEGIEIEIVLFTDYVQPNISLQDGSVDLNAFQHVAFLNDWNDSNDGDLVPIGYTYVTPIGVYSDKIESLDELKDGDTVAIPNDPTNGGRALLALELAGVIEVDDAAGILPEVKDITSNPKNIQFEELEAGQLARVLPDVAAAVINNTFALDAGLNQESAIFLDTDNPAELSDDYKNVIATRKDDKDNEVYRFIVSLYQTDEVKEKLAEVSDGGDVPAWSDQDDL